MFRKVEGEEIKFLFIEEALSPDTKSFFIGSHFF